MAVFRRVTPDFAVAAQLTVEDIARAAVEGFATIVNNRPEGEAGDQLTGADAEAAARAAGLAYRALPFSPGPPPPAVLAETADLLDAAKGPVLAYCRTGTRSVTAWAMAQALAGTRRPEEIIALAAGAGYDLSGTRDVLDRLSPA